MSLFRHFLHSHNTKMLILSCNCVSQSEIIAIINLLLHRYTWCLLQNVNILKLYPPFRRLSLYSFLFIVLSTIFNLFICTAHSDVNCRDCFWGAYNRTYSLAMPVRRSAADDWMPKFEGLNIGIQFKHRHFTFT